MTATATILNVWCLRAATGTDAGVNQALSGLAESIPLDSLGVPLENFIKSLPEAATVIDTARSDPDELYLTTDTVGGLANSIWPGGDATVSLQADQSVSPNVDVSVDFAQNLSLWEHDSMSDDDLLGSIRILEEEQGRGAMAKMAKSPVEGSVYYVTYRVR